MKGCTYRLQMQEKAAEAHMTRNPKQMHKHELDLVPDYPSPTHPQGRSK